jgi:integrase/recombinase XerD
MNSKDISPVQCYLMTLAPSGQRSMKSQLTQVARLLGQNNIDDVQWHKLEYQELIFVRSRLKSLNKSTNTINTSMAALRGVVRCAFKMGLLNAEQMERICQLENVRGDDKKSGIALSLDESRRLVESAAAVRGPQGIRDSALLMLMVSTGLRRSEVASLNLDCFDFDRDQITIKGKGGKLRHIDISGVTLSLLIKWRSEIVGKGGHPFFTKVLKEGVTEKRITSNTVYRLVKNYGKSIGVRDLRPHDLRRTYISLLLEQGTDLSLVSRTVGHASVTTTTRYDKRHVSAQTRASRKLITSLGEGIAL